jgi:hypothetical protein
MVHSGFFSAAVSPSVRLHLRTFYQLPPTTMICMRWVDIGGVMGHRLVLQVPNEICG